MKILLIARLNQFGLTISDKKTHQTNLSFRAQSKTHERRHMTFLGFTIYRAKNRSGTAIKTVFRTDKSRYGRARESAKQTIKRIQHWPVKEQAKMLGAVLRGHFNYYGIAGNAARINNFWHQVQNEWRHSLSRRSQRGRVNWAEFASILKQYPLPPPRVRLSYNDLIAYHRL